MSFIFKIYKIVFVFIIICVLSCKSEKKYVAAIYETGGYAARYKEILQNINVDNSSCFLDIFDTINAALRGEIWALKMFDASGKLQSSYLEGNIISLGSYSECMSAKGITLNHEIKGKYCLSFTYFPFLKAPNFTYGVSKDVRNIVNENTGIPLITGICLPESCTAEDMNYLLNLTLNFELQPVYIKFDENFCSNEGKTNDFTFLHWITMILYLLTFLLMFLSTFYELYLLKHNLEPYHTLLISYSIYSNLIKLYKIRKDPDQLSCINGIRTISMMWIILGHKYLIYGPFPHVNYLYILQEWMKNTSTSFVIGAIFSVDTFFFISGLLIIYVVLLAKSKQFHFNLIYFYLHRQFRLSPAFFMVILFYMTFLSHSSSGPIWPVISKHVTEGCTQHWWYSILYIQNALNSEDICVNQSWYLAADTQLYILSPLLFLSLQRWPKRTIYITFLLIVFSCVFGFSIVWILGINGKLTEFKKVYHILNNSILSRCNSWLIGALFGYYLFRKRGEKIIIHRTLVTLFWFLSILIMVLIVLMMEYFYNYQYNKWITSIFYGISKTLWSVSLCWIVFACVHGYGGIVNKFLSSKIFMILGRLTYSMYLIHVAYLVIRIYGGEINTRFTNSTILYDYISDVVIIVIISHIWTLAFESPLIAIGKYLMPADLSQKLAQIHEDNENVNTSL